MNDHNAQIFTSSALKVTKRFTIYGAGDVSDISLLKLCYKYSCYSSDYETLQKMDKIVAELQMKGNDICMDISNGNFLPGDGSVTVPVNEDTNTAPTVSNNTVNILADEDFYTFKLEDFTKDFADAEGHGPGKIVLKSDIPGLYYDGVDVITGQVIFEPEKLVYNRASANGYTDQFDFSIFDDYLDSPKESADTTMTIDVADATNLPAEIGDNTIYAANRVITVLTLEMFTSQLAPPYNDPENDLIDAIRIDEISNANQGVYRLNGVDVIEGDIITREDLAASLFTHHGASVDTVSSDTLSFSARDEGSLIWVQ